MLIMQLFVCDFQIKGNIVVIEDKDILNQIRKVLRMKIGDYFFVQEKINPNKRYRIKIKEWNDKTLYADIEGIEDKLIGYNINYGMIIAMPNRRDKLELIVQKLTEIGINDIVFWPSERSVIKKLNESKFQRLLKISKEALEQSWGWNLPKIQFLNQISDCILNSKLIIFDKTLNSTNHLDDIKIEASVYGIIGPEGGLTQKDYDDFGKNFEIISLGNSVLRMETAAIVGGWLIKNYKL